VPQLWLHPEGHCPDVSRIDVVATRPVPGVLTLCYVVRGAIAGVFIPTRTLPVRTEGLWTGTCFEAFVRLPDADGYTELNASPSTQWAAYAFDRYRKGMTVFEDVEPPVTEVYADDDMLEVHVSFRLGLPDTPVWCLGLSAVIAENNGNRSYWALAHPPGKPDFHHEDCFVHEVRAAKRA
jgi:hypothetical protein